LLLLVKIQPREVLNLMVKNSMLKIGVIGYGYWGPNVVRNFTNAGGAIVAAVSDINPNSLARVRSMHPSVEVTQNPDDILLSPEIDAVAIVTPPLLHFPMAKKALENGKHVFVEKPFTCSTAEAEQLIEIADRKHLQIMVDHTFLFTGAVRKIRELIDNDTLGTLYYYDSTRVNLGMFQNDTNVVWDLAPHDLSIMDYLIRRAPEAVVNCACSCCGAGPEAAGGGVRAVTALGSSPTAGTRALEPLRAALPVRGVAPGVSRGGPAAATVLPVRLTVD